MQSTKTFNSLHCYSTIFLLFIDCTVYLSILLDFDKVHSNHNQIPYDSTTMVPKAPTMEANR